MSAHPIQARFSEQIAAATDLAALDAVRVAALGKSGEITELLKSLGKMDADTRLAEAPKIHALREAVADAIEAKKQALENAELERRLATERLDLSLPAAESPRGSRDASSTSWANRRNSSVRPGSCGRGGPKGPFKVRR